MQILILDRDQNLADLINREFESALVHYAADGDIGLKIASEKQFDLIVMDSAILKTDALSVVQELREQKVLTPILMVTEEDSVRNIVHLLDSGANDCITRPFEFDVIAARMKALIRRSKWDLCAEVGHGHVVFGPAPCESMGRPMVDDLQYLPNVAAFV